MTTCQVPQYLAPQVLDYLTPSGTAILTVFGSVPLMDAMPLPLDLEVEVGRFGPNVGGSWNRTEFLAGLLGEALRLLEEVQGAEDSGLASHGRHPFNIRSRRDTASRKDTFSTAMTRSMGL